MKYTFISIFLLLFSHLVFCGDLVGMVKGKASVTQGDFVYELEIETPKGVAGLKPTLELSYNSSNHRNSIFGLGFTISGFPVIVKCRENLFAEKKNPSRNYNYRLNNQKLVLIDAHEQYGGENTEYRTEINKHLKIKKTALGWIVWDKSDLIYEYGLKPDARKEDVLYKISKISDRYGNEINYYYSNKENGEEYIQRIVYSNIEINFSYQERKDKRTICVYGVKSAVNHLVEKISVVADGKELYCYQFSYDNQNIQPRLAKIDRCFAGNNLKPLIFEWHKGQNVFSDWQSWGQNATTNEQYQEWGGYSQFVDVNGDGLPDRVHHHNYKTNQYGYWVQICRR